MTPSPCAPWQAAQMAANVTAPASAIAGSAAYSASAPGSVLKEGPVDA